MERVRFFSFSAGEFLDEELYYLAEKLAAFWRLSMVHTEALLAFLCEERKGSGQHPFEWWGPQWLSDDINESDKKGI